MFRRRAAALLGLIVLGVGSGAVAGCAAKTTDGRRAQRAASAGQALRPAVSSGESLRVLDDYVARYNKAVSGGDGRAWRRLLADPLAATADARLRIGNGRPPDRRTITLVNPVLFVPKLDAYPMWFVAAAMERPGRQGKPRQVLLMFTRDGQEAAWRLANRTVTAAKLPKIATDGQGYAIAVAPQPSGRLAVPLSGLATAHAAYLKAGAGPFAPGPYTSEWRAGRTAWARRLRSGGWLDKVTFAQTRYAPVALRTKDGGVLAWYAVSRLDDLVAGTSRPAPDPGAIPADIRGYLGGRPARSHAEVRAAWLLLPLTYVPPATATGTGTGGSAGTGGQASVLGLTTDLTSAATVTY